MPDPRKLKVGDKIRFVGLPEEWSVPGAAVAPQSVAFMKKMIGRKRPSRIHRIAEDGSPWIQARLRDGDGIAYHEWGIYEETGWRLVRKKGTA